MAGAAGRRTIHHHFLAFLSGGDTWAIICIHCGPGRSANDFLGLSLDSFVKTRRQSSAGSLANLGWGQKKLYFPSSRMPYFSSMNCANVVH